MILPGSKNTRSDLDWLYHSGWAKELVRFAANKGHVLGICGGYQMLGQTVHDPDGVEGSPGSTEGLDVLPVLTTLKEPKTTSWSEFSWGGTRGSGYEIHMGCTELLPGGVPLFKVLQRNGLPCQDHDGCISENGRVLGCYLHGLFDEPQILAAWLGWIGVEGFDLETETGWLQARQREYDLLAKHLQEHVDMPKILDLFETSPR